MSDTGAYNGWTILDYLNEYCLMAVLSYVPARDLMRTERASRRWQQVVLSHLRGLHISITVKNKKRRNKVNFNACPLDYSKYKSFKVWTSKLGSSVVSTYCESWKSLEIIRVNCPNLETLMFYKLPKCQPERFSHNLNKDFKNLKRLYFNKCGVSDPCISQLIADKALEELVIDNCRKLDGECLNTMDFSKLKSLVIKHAFDLNEQYLLSAVGRLGELTRLKLNYVSRETSEEIQYVLGDMPKLEELEIVDYRIHCHAYEPLSCLTRLKRLNVRILLGDDGLEAVARGCKELRSLVVLCEGMTPYGAHALGRLGASLTSLTLADFVELDDDGLLAIIGGCLELKLLDVSGASLLSPALPARARAAWRAARPRRRLEIHLSVTSLENDGVLDIDDRKKYQDMKKLYKKMMRNYGELVIVLEPEGGNEYNGENEDDEDSEDSEDSE